ncbi:RNA polymerase beta prime subunit [Vibrio phage vB_pir03]|nr:RNA polymerase beta prime subunit [Vibrio phage vB_pir03]
MTKPTLKEKGLVFRPVNFEEQFNALKSPPIIVNELSVDTKDDERFLESLTVTTCSTTDVLENRPRCLCGKYNKAHQVGIQCDVCGQVVASPNLRAIQSDLWIAAPHEIEFLFMPLAWVMLSKPLTHRKFNGLEWMCNPNKVTPEVSSNRANCKTTRIIEGFHNLGIRRGLRSVIENFDVILDKIILKNITNVQRRLELQLFVQKYRNAIFTRVIPLPSKVAMIIEETSVGTYYDQTIDSAVEAAFTAAGIKEERDITRLEARFTSVMVNLGEYYQNVVTNVLSGKPGWLRRVLYGNRLNFSYRGIITSRHEPHEYDTLIVPYNQLLSCLQHVVVRRLVRQHGFTLSAAMAYVNEHAKDCDPLLWHILEDLIDETPPLKPNEVSPVEAEIGCTLKTRSVRKGRGIITTLTRYPSLDRLSTQRFRIVGISRDDIKISVISIKGPNADKIKQYL